MPCRPIPCGQPALFESTHDRYGDDPIIPIRSFLQLLKTVGVYNACASIDRVASVSITTPNPAFGVASQKCSNSFRWCSVCTEGLVAPPHRKEDYLLRLVEISPSRECQTLMFLILGRILISRRHCFQSRHSSISAETNNFLG